MSWIIERDENDEPVRLWWAPGADEYIAEQHRAIEKARAENSYPMPAMREWAKARGLIE